jgi:hypothetical protein
MFVQLKIGQNQTEVSKILKSGFFIVVATALVMTGAALYLPSSVQKA